MAKLTDRSPAPPPGSPFLPPAQRPRLPLAGPALRQRAFAALILAVLSVIAMILGGSSRRPEYVAAVALVVALIGLLLAVSAMRGAKRAKARRPGAAVAGVVIGLIGILFSGSLLGVFLLYPSQFTQYVNCLNGATTATAQNACWQQLQKSVGPGATVIRGK